MTDSQSYLRVEIHDKHARVTIDRPKAANAITPAMLLDLVRTYEELDATQQFNVIVLSGAGRGFCAGHDLRRGARAANDSPPVPAADQAPDDDVLTDWTRLRGANRALLRLREGDTPILAQVHGYCLGSGVDLMVSCDLAVATKSCRFAHPAIRASGGTPSAMAYPYWIGAARTKQFLWVMPEVTGAEAATWGLINHAVDDDELESTVDDWVSKMSSLPKENITIQRHHLRRIQELQGYRSAVELGADLDALAHTGAASAQWRDAVNAHGFGEAVRRRDEAFNDSNPVC